MLANSCVSPHTANVNDRIHLCFVLLFGFESNGSLNPTTVEWCSDDGFFCRPTMNQDAYPRQRAVLFPNIHI